MLRITLVSRDPVEEVYALEGWIVDEETRLLADTCGGVVARGARLVLDLGGVRFIDDGGLVVLSGWAGPKLRLRRASDLVAQLLAGYGMGCEPTEARSE